MYLTSIQVGGNYLARVGNLIPYFGLIISDEIESIGLLGFIE